MFRWLLTLAVVLLALAGTATAGSVPRLVVPRLGIDAPLAGSLAGGPVLYWHDDDTVAIAGHDVTPVPGYGGHGPFRHLDWLRPGDAIVFAGRRYRVVRARLVLPSETWVLNWRGLVLSACWPPHSAAHRLVVFAR